MEVNDLIKLIGIIAGLITSVTVICTFLKSAIDKGFEPIRNEIKMLDVNQCKNFLVTFLKAVEKGEVMDEVETQRAYEVYDHYVKDLQGNSYIHAKWEKLMK